MKKTSPTSFSPPHVPAEQVARTLRHEVGDLLQTIYASVAILLERVEPERSLERRILGDLRNRAETCKNMLDTVHDLICPINLAYETFDPSELVNPVVVKAAARHLQIEIQCDLKFRQPIEADPRYLLQVVQRLLHHACQRAERVVSFQTDRGAGDNEMKWIVTDDGPRIPAEELPRLMEPFATTRPGPLGLDLGLARKVVQMHGGRMEASNRPEGGLAVQVVLPVRPAATP